MPPFFSVSCAAPSCVQVAPGATQLTRMPYGERSIAMDWQARMSAALVMP